MLLGIAGMVSILSQRRAGPDAGGRHARPRCPGAGGSLLLRPPWGSGAEQHPPLSASHTGARSAHLPAASNTSLAVNRLYQKSPCSA